MCPQFCIAPQEFLIFLRFFPRCFSTPAALLTTRSESQSSEELLSAAQMHRCLNRFTKKPHKHMTLQDIQIQAKTIAQFPLVGKPFLYIDSFIEDHRSIWYRQLLCLSLTEANHAPCFSYRQRQPHPPGLAGSFYQIKIGDRFLSPLLKAASPVPTSRAVGASIRSRWRSGYRRLLQLTSDADKMTGNLQLEAID